MGIVLAQNFKNKGITLDCQTTLLFTYCQNTILEVQEVGDLESRKVLKFKKTDQGIPKTLCLYALYITADYYVGRKYNYLSLQI